MIIGLILSFVIASGSVISVYGFETEITNDRGIGCGNLHWGIKNFKNDNPDENFFTRDSNCDEIPANSPYFDRDNVAVLHTEIITPEPNSFRWQAILQGEDPFGNNATEGGALIDNTNFPYDEIEENLRLRVQWLWSNTETPNSSSDELKARFLTNLWFEHKTATDPKVLIVIDLLVDELNTDLQTGNWFQFPSENVDNDSPFDNYSIQHCNLIPKPGGNSEQIYHFSVILDDKNRDIGEFREVTRNIKEMISAAISHTLYDQRDGCSSSKPLGNITDYQLTNIEQGIELNAIPSTANHIGAVEGGYSFSELIVECESPPPSGAWMIDSDCAIPESISFDGNVIVTNNSLLKILDNVTLDLNLGDGNSLTAQAGSGIIIKSTAKIT